MAIRIIAITMTFASVVGFCQADQGDIDVTFDLTYVSKWLSKGVEAYGQQGGLFKTIDLKFVNKGLGIKVTHRNATSSGYVDNRRFDYRPYTFGQLFGDKSYATNYNISVGYEHYPGLARNVANTTFEWIFAFNWPKLLGDKLTPGYVVHYEYPAGSGYDHSNITGWVHRFMLGYDAEVPGLPSDLHLSSEVAYTDGLGGAEHDWSYATFGISTVFKMGSNMSLCPGLYHQVSMEDSVSTRKDITYVQVSFKYKF